MTRAEEFSKHYPLTRGRLQLIEEVLTGQEVPIRLGYAMVERLKEQGELAGMQFMAAAIVGKDVVRVYFLAQDSLYLMDFPMSSRDAGRNVFDNLASFKSAQVVPDVRGDCFYVEYEHRQN